MATAEGTPRALVPPVPPTPAPDFPECCSSDDAHAVGRGPLTILRQIAAACTYPELLDSPTVPEGARRRARQILQEMDAGNIGGYNHEHRSLGVPARVAHFLERRDDGVPCDPRHIILTSGTASILPFVMSLVAEEEATPAKVPGVLMPVPGPLLPRAAAELAGAVAVPYPLDEERGWAVAVAAVREVLERAQGRCHPKVFFVVNPGDPTGHVLSRRDMEDIIRLAAEENLLLLADEVQQDRAFIPGRPFLSFKRVLWELGAPLASTVQLISFYSLSKSIAGECGFRAGFLELVNVEEEVARPFQLAQSIPRPCVLGRILLDLLMDPPSEEDTVQKALEERQELLRDLSLKAQLVQEVLGRVPGIFCQPVQGGARACPRLQLPPRAQSHARALGLEPDVFFCRQLLKATGVVLAPGSEFGQPEGTHHVVVSLLPPVATLERVLLTLTSFYAAFLQEFS